MITLIMGAPGAGKSYESVRYHVIPALRRGRKVITNLPLNIEELKRTMPYLDPGLLEIRTKTKSIREGITNKNSFSQLEDYEDSWRDEKTGIGPLFIIDEAHKALPKETRTKEGTPRDVEEFYAEHRHHGYDITLITQTLRKVSEDITGLVEMTYRLTKARFLGRDKKYIRKVVQGIKGAVMDTQEREYDPRYFNLYQSHTHSTTSVIEATAQDFIPGHRKYLFAAGFLIFTSIILLIYHGNPFKVRTPTEPQIKKEVDVGAAPIGGGPASTSKPIEASSDLKPETSHPLKQRGVHIIGSWKRTSNQERRVYFSVSLNGIAQFQLTDQDLVNQGYAYVFHSDCQGSLWFQGKYIEEVFCDSPRISMSLPHMASN